MIKFIFSNLLLVLFLGIGFGQYSCYNIQDIDSYSRSMGLMYNLKLCNKGNDTLEQWRVRCDTEAEGKRQGALNIGMVEGSAGTAYQQRYDLCINGYSNWNETNTIDYTLPFPDFNTNYTSSLTSCQRKYGLDSVSTGNKMCTCKIGYDFQDDGKGGLSCLKLTKDILDKNCSSNHGQFSVSSGYDLCICLTGYYPNTENGLCEKEIIQEVNNSSDQELKSAVSWMYNNGLTIFTDPTNFMSSNSLRRDEAAKFFVKYAKEIIGMTPDKSKTMCSFKDLGLAWLDLKEVIKESCQLGLFQGYNGKFNPTQLLTNAQAITVFVRLIDGYKDESGIHFANEYYKYAHNIGLLSGTNLDIKNSFDLFVTRGDVAKMLFRGR